MVFVTEFPMQPLDRRTFKYAMRLHHLRALSREVVEVEGVLDFEDAHGIRPGATCCSRASTSSTAAEAGIWT